MTSTGRARTSPATGPFVGRQRHLRALHDAFKATLTGAQTTVCIAGPSGMASRR